MIIPAQPGWWHTFVRGAERVDVERAVLAWDDETGRVLVDDAGRPDWVDVDRDGVQSFVTYGTEKHPVNVSPAPAGFEGVTPWGETATAHFVGFGNETWCMYTFIADGDEQLVSLRATPEPEPVLDRIGLD